MKPIAEMTMTEMLKEYNTLTNSTVKKFSDRATAERRLKGVRNADPQPDAPIPIVSETAAASAAKTKPSFGPKPKHSKKLSEAIRESWNNKTTAARRAQRDAVTVDGREFRSVPSAFQALKLPMNKCIRFRMQVKKAGKDVFEYGDKKYHFAIVKKEEK